MRIKNYIETITDADAIDAAMEHVESFLKDPNQKVFQILGHYGIGKRKALQKLLDQHEIKPEKHKWTIIDTSKPIEECIMKHPDSIHLWDDVFRSNIMNKNVYNFFSNLASNKIQFNGKFILVANEKEFPKFKFPDLPGIHIKMSLEDTISHIVKIKKEQGVPELSIKNSIQIIKKSFGCK